MRLSRPKVVTWWIAVIVGILGILEALFPYNLIRIA